MSDQQQTSLKSHTEGGRSPFFSWLPVAPGRLFALPSALLPVLLLFLLPPPAAAQNSVVRNNVASAGQSGAASAAGDQSSLTALTTHRHDPIVVRSKPVIERLPVKVIQPVDLKVSADGRILVADAQAS